jgi:hypothetical protein
MTNFQSFLSDHGDPDMTFPANTPNVDDLPGLPLQDIAQLPVDLLATLQRDVDERIKRDKSALARLDGALTIRYATRAAEARQAAGKDTGTVRLVDADVTVVADLPKKVEWDQHDLADLVERIKAEGEDTRDYVEVSLKVSERKYGSWPAHIRKAFEPCRTVHAGKETFQLILAGGDA